MQTVAQALGFISFFLFFAFPLDMWARPLPKTEPGFLIGMEIELHANHFAKITHFFDFKKFQSDVTTHLAHPTPDNPLKSWDTLYAIVPEEIRDELKTTPWKDLSALSQAKLAISLGWINRTKDLSLQIRKDAPREVQTLFKKLVWHRDRYKMEFKHRFPETDLATYVADVLSFARLAGVEDKILNELASPITGVSYHFHISGSKLLSKKLLQKFNRLILLKKLSLGFTDDMTETQGLALYRHDLTARGLLRKIAENRFETRCHPFDFYSMLDLAVGIQNENSPEISAKIDGLARQLLTPQVLEQMAFHAPPFLNLFDDLLTEAQQKAYTEKVRTYFDPQKHWSLEEVQKLLDIHGHVPLSMEFYALLLKLSFDTNPKIQKEALDFLWDGPFRFPDALWDDFVKSADVHLQENPTQLVAVLGGVQNTVSEDLKQKLLQIKNLELRASIRRLFSRPTCAPLLNPKSS